MSDPDPASPRSQFAGDGDWRYKLSTELNRLHDDGSLVTYLELADRLAIPSPQRIHRLTQWLETSMAEDARANRTPRAALVVSRTQPGRPAPGFFDKAKDLGLMQDESPEAFHDQLLQALAIERAALNGDPHHD